MSLERDADRDRLFLAAGDLSSAVVALRGHTLTDCGSEVRDLLAIRDRLMKRWQEVAAE